MSILVRWRPRLGFLHSVRKSGMNAAAATAKFRSMNGKVERERDAIEAAKRRKEDGAHLCGHGRLLTTTLVSVCRWK